MDPDLKTRVQDRISTLGQYIESAEREINTFGASIDRLNASMVKFRYARDLLVALMTDLPEGPEEDVG